MAEVHFGVARFNAQASRPGRLPPLAGVRVFALSRNLGGTAEFQASSQGFGMRSFIFYQSNLRCIMEEQIKVLRQQMEEALAAVSSKDELAAFWRGS